MNILIIDENPTQQVIDLQNQLQQTLCGITGYEGTKVFLAENEQEALVVLSRKIINVIIIDMFMTASSLVGKKSLQGNHKDVGVGYVLYITLKNMTFNYPKAPLFIMSLSESHKNELADKIPKRGVKYVSKPYNFDQTFEAITLGCCLAYC